MIIPKEHFTVKIEEETKQSQSLSLWSVRFSAFGRVEEMSLEPTASYLRSSHEDVRAQNMLKRFSTLKD